MIWPIVEESILDLEFCSNPIGDGLQFMVPHILHIYNVYLHRTGLTDKTLAVLARSIIASGAEKFLVAKMSKRRCQKLPQSKRNLE